MFDHWRSPKVARALSALIVGVTVLLVGVTAEAAPRPNFLMAIRYGANARRALRDGLGEMLCVGSG